MSDVNDDTQTPSTAQSDVVLPAHTDGTPAMPGKNGGRLKRGGSHEGSGPTPKAIRGKLRKMFDENLKFLEKTMKDKKASRKDKLECLKLMGKYGVGELSSVIDDEGNALGTTLQIIERDEAVLSETDTEERDSDA